LSEVTQGKLYKHNEEIFHDSDYPYGVAVEVLLDEAKADFPPKEGPTGTIYSYDERVAVIDKWFKRWFGAP
jgi:hypothetical protein